MHHSSLAVVADVSKDKTLSFPSRHFCMYHLLPVCSCVPIILVGAIPRCLFVCCGKCFRTPQSHLCMQIFDTNRTECTQHTTERITGALLEHVRVGEPNMGITNRILLPVPDRESNAASPEIVFTHLLIFGMDESTSSQ
mmetsp:Transcript_9883/g.26969  ORF Transcript_9883/g.26969 Transcript_9883/m.26969 type:complete len:139 (-) Transcript_9883:842-1258(-)